jgi:hypothetical protein
MPIATDLTEALELLDLHFDQFFKVLPAAQRTGHPVPTDTRAWSQILVSTLVGIRGRERSKGSDLEDGSDVKAANLWSAVDTPRFNGVLPAGRLSGTSQKPEASSALDGTPFLFFVLWDNKGVNRAYRCRVWVVRASMDPVFRAMADTWYERRAKGLIRSLNFQLHPPRNTDINVFRNEAGNLAYPLLLEAVHDGQHFKSTEWHPEVLDFGVCSIV